LNFRRRIDNMKLTPSRRKFVSFMSGPYGRLIRAAMGLALVVLAITQMGWYWLLLLPAAFMFWTAAVSFCPVTLLFPEIREEDKLKNKVPSYKLKL
jgi:hypothetical protein